MESRNSETIYGVFILKIPLYRVEHSNEPSKQYFCVALDVMLYG